MAILTNEVSPVLVTGAHFSPMRNARGTMDTGDERRYDSFGFDSRLCAGTNVGLTRQHLPRAGGILLLIRLG